MRKRVLALLGVLSVLGLVVAAWREAGQVKRSMEAIADA